MDARVNKEAERREIEAALERAAYKATHGTREERSGRFLPKAGSKATLSLPTAKEREKIASRSKRGS